jgi:hypothetical protein
LSLHFNIYVCWEFINANNRDENDRAGTLQNLQRFGFSDADNAHLLLRQNTSGKQARCQQVIAEHDIVLLESVVKRFIYPQIVKLIEEKNIIYCKVFV